MFDSISQTLGTAWRTTQLIGAAWLATQLVAADYAYKDAEKDQKLIEQSQSIGPQVSLDGVIGHVTVYKTRPRDQKPDPLQPVWDYILKPGTELGKYLYQQDRSPS